MKQFATLLFIVLFGMQGVALASESFYQFSVIDPTPTGVPKWDAKIFPNPSNGVVNIMINGSLAALMVRVYNVIGERVYQVQIIADQGAKLDLSSLEKGLYVIQIADEKKGEMITRRMNIE